MIEFRDIIFKKKNFEFILSKNLYCQNYMKINERTLRINIRYIEFVGMHFFLIFKYEQTYHYICQVCNPLNEIMNRNQDFKYVTQVCLN